MMIFISGASCAIAYAIIIQGGSILCVPTRILPLPHPQRQPMPSRNYFIRQTPPIQRIPPTMTLTRNDPTSDPAPANSHTDAHNDAHTGPLYALFDCNSFYANCERLFRPDLRRRPIVVLSNNDGCVIARCDQAHQWVKMGALYHQVRAHLKQHNVAVFSSNYALYANLSDRVMRTLQDCLPQVQIYSIDEAFAQLHPGDAPETLCRQAQQRVLQ